MPDQELSVEVRAEYARSGTFCRGRSRQCQTKNLHVCRDKSRPSLGCDRDGPGNCLGRSSDGPSLERPRGERVRAIPFRGLQGRQTGCVMGWPRLGFRAGTGGGCEGYGGCGGRNAGVQPERSQSRAPPEAFSGPTCVGTGGTAWWGPPLDAGACQESGMAGPPLESQTAACCRTETGRGLNPWTPLAETLLLLGVPRTLS